MPFRPATRSSSAPTACSADAELKRGSAQHTGPTNGSSALHEPLLRRKEEGLEKPWARHTRHHLALKASLEAMGLKYVVKEGNRLPQMNSVYVPAGLAPGGEAEVRKI